MVPIKGRSCISAIDMTENISAALEAVISLGFERVLTSGGDSTALEGLPTICEMVKQVMDKNTYTKILVFVT